MLDKRLGTSAVWMTLLGWRVLMCVVKPFPSTERSGTGTMTSSSEGNTVPPPPIRLLLTLRAFFLRAMKSFLFREVFAKGRALEKRCRR